MRTHHLKQTCSTKKGATTLLLQLLDILSLKGWAQQGMILRPPDYESDALTN
jgi:hypothetical protein